MNALCQYHWPGNVRELAHVIERAIILSDTDILDVCAVVGLDKVEFDGTSNALGERLLMTNEDDAVVNNSEVKDDDDFNLDRVEQRTVRAALKHHQGNVTKAAKALGLTRGAMYRRLEKYDL
jgi:transcriptional regulator with PAS, ATPase and Fis domain